MPFLVVCGTSHNSVRELWPCEVGEPSPEAPKGQSSQSVCKRNYLNNKFNGELPKIRKVR